VHDLNSEEVQKRLQDSKAGLIIDKTTKKLLAGWATNDEFGLEVIKAILFAIRLELTVEQIEETIHAHPLITELPYDIARRANTIIVDGQIRQAKKG
jgi:pyruvate/2-oxoglutarate dehydrogenase complex dihydrolipoamide dehydrogenase (E3) component